MASNFISTYNLLNGPRVQSRNAQAEIARLGKEIVDARHADVGLVLGAKTGHSTVLYQELGRVQMFVTSNGLTSGRLDVTQAALTELRETAENTLATLVGLPTNELGAATIKGEAERTLKALAEKLNSAYAGQQLFGGIKTDAEPVDLAAGTAAVDAAFANFLTAYQTYWTAGGNAGVATVNDIGAREMGLFLNPVDPATLDPLVETPEFIALATSVWTGANNARFDQEFDDTNWKGNWSSASDTNLASRISQTETIESSVNANNAAFRQLAKAYAVLGALPADSLNEGAFKAAVDYAIAQLGEAVNGVTLLQADLGSAQARITTVNESLATQKTLLQNNITDLEGVDPAEAKASLDMVELQLSLSYSLTSRLQKLNLLNYL